MEGLSQVLSKSSLVLLLRLLGILGGYLFMLVVSRNFGSKVWGDFSIFLVILQLLGSVAKFGLDTTFLKLASETWVKKKYSLLSRLYVSSLTLLILFSLIISLITYFSANYMAIYVFHKPYLGIYFRFISFLIPFFALLGLHSEGLRAISKILLHMLSQQAGLFLCAFLSLGLLYHVKYDLGGLLPFISYAIAVLFCLIIAVSSWLVFSRTRVKLFIFSDLTLELYRYILRLSLPLFISGIASMLMTWTDIIMLGIFLPSSDVGIYSVALRISTLVSIVLIAVNTVAAPKFAGFWALGKADELIFFAKKVTQFISVISIILFSVVIFFGKEVLMFFGNEYVNGLSSLIVLSFGQLINAMAGSVGYILIMTQYQTFHRNVILLGALLNVTLNFVLIPYLGILGAAFSTTLTLVFWNVIFSWKVKQIFGKWIFGF